MSKWINSNCRMDAYDIKGNKAWAIIVKCPYCEFQHFAIEGHISQYNYCPNCGATMEAKE